MGAAKTPMVETKTARAIENFILMIGLGFVLPEKLVCVEGWDYLRMIFR